MPTVKRQVDIKVQHVSHSQTCIAEKPQGLHNYKNFDKSFSHFVRLFCNFDKCNKYATKQTRKGEE